jgi:hypothetical protein
MLPIAAILGAITAGAGLGSAFKGGGDENQRTTQTTTQAPFSWINYPPQAPAGASQLYNSLFGAPTEQPLTFAQWQARFYASNPVTNRPDRIARRQQEYSDYLNNFYSSVGHEPSAVQGIVEESLPYYQQFLDEQLPMALTPYEEFLQSTPAAEWQTIREDLGRGLNEAELAQQQYASQYGTAGANQADWERLYGGYLGEEARQRRLLEQGWGERQMAAGTNYANLAGMGPQTAASMAALQMMPYDYQQQYLNSILGRTSQGGTTTQISPQYTPNVLENILGGVMGGLGLYNAYNQPTTTTTPTTNYYNYGGGYTYPASPNLTQNQFPWWNYLQGGQ